MVAAKKLMFFFLHSNGSFNDTSFQVFFSTFRDCKESVGTCKLVAMIIIATNLLNILDAGM